MRSRVLVSISVTFFVCLVKCLSYRWAYWARGWSQQQSGRCLAVEFSDNHDNIKRHSNNYLTHSNVTHSIDSAVGVCSGSAGEDAVRGCYHQGGFESAAPDHGRCLASQLGAPGGGWVPHSQGSGSSSRFSVPPLLSPFPTPSP